ncbi:unnamed protein product [Cyprideis torosa]|uniref:Uncharacterized protein n=1 Tax=Cyprideis torosa TaxID=163714 RepID=A0A7R8ZXZ9_9CRUS|nr:unnamed protein product [Cyprideis torosa]CAG0907605.1 unnamed protein product [Cyprideis torosa]
MTPSSPLENGKPEGMKLSGHSGGRKYGRSVTVLGTPGGPQVNFTTTQSDSGVPLHQSGSADEESKRRKAREEIISRLTKRASILGDDDRRFARSSLIRPRSTYLLSSMGSDNDPLPPTSPQPSAAPPGKVTISLRVRREPQSAYGRSLLQTPAGVGGSESGGGPSSISPGRTTDNIRSSMSPTLLNLIRSTEALYNSEAANKEARRGTLVAHEDEDDGPHNTSRGERSGSGTPRNSPGPPSGETEPLVNRMKKEGKLKGGHRLSEEKEVARKPRIGRPPAGTDVPVNDVQRRCPPATSELEESLDNDLNAKIEERKLSDGSRSGSSGPPSRKSSAGSRIPRRLSNDSSADDGPHLPSRSPQISPISNPYAMSALQELENEESVSERIRRKSYYSRFNSEVGLGTPVSSIRRRPSHKLSGSAVGLDGSDGGGLGGLPQRRTSPGFWRDSPTTELLGNDVRSTSVSPLFHSERHSSSRTPEADPRRILRR